MKVIVYTELYGEKVLFRPYWGEDAIYFEGKQPKKDQLLTLELPDLKEFRFKPLMTWLAQKSLPVRERREVARKPSPAAKPRAASTQRMNGRTVSGSVYALSACVKRACA